MHKVSTFFEKSLDTYYLRVTTKDGNGMYIIYDSLGTNIGIAQEYVPAEGTHLLGIYPLTISDLDFKIVSAVNMGRDKNAL